MALKDKNKLVVNRLKKKLKSLQKKQSDLFELQTEFLHNVIAAYRLDTIKGLHFVDISALSPHATFHKIANDELVMVDGILRCFDKNSYVMRDYGSMIKWAVNIKHINLQLSKIAKDSIWLFVDGSVPLYSDFTVRSTPSRLDLGEPLKK